MTRRFTHINENFNCAVCEREIKPHPSSCRNHCPFCLSSLHLDINPGDRLSPCKGVMKAISYDLNSKKGLMIHHKCTKCDEIKVNRSAHEATVQPDDYNKILALKAHHQSDYI